MFINDITNVLNCNVQLYADDIKISLPISGINDHQALQLAIDAAVNWSIANCMPLNQGKTVVASFTRKTNPSYFLYEMQGSVIQRKSEVSDLGVLMDSKLYFSNHVSSIVSKARRNLGLIMWIARFFSDIESCLALYRSLVRSHLEYATVVWNRDRGYSDAAIEAVQKRFISWLFWKFPELGECDVRSTLKLPLLSARRTLADLRFFRGVLHGQSCSIDSVGLRAPGYTFRLSRLFVTSYVGVCDPVVRCAGIANLFCNDLDFFDDANKFLGQARLVCM